MFIVIDFKLELEDHTFIYYSILLTFETVLLTSRLSQLIQNKCQSYYDYTLLDMF